VGADLFALQDTIDPISNPPRCRCQGLAPNTPYLFPFPRQRVVQNQNSKVSPEVPGRF
jgi:hypothetical protein